MTPLRISVVINTCDRVAPLRNLLYSLHQQTYPHFEVIVVVGPTTDDTIEMLEAEFGESVIVGRCAKYNLCISRNDGIAIAAGDVIAFIDDDAIPSRTWLEDIAATMSDPQIAAVSGRIHYNVVPNVDAQHFRHSLISLYGHLLRQEEPESALLLRQIPPKAWIPRLVGTNMAFRYDALTAIGGDDEYYAYLLEDPDFGMRLHFAGYTIKTLDHATVYHAPAASRNRILKDGTPFVYSTNWYLEACGFVYYMLKNISEQGKWRIALRNAAAVWGDMNAKLRLYLETGIVTREEAPDIRRQIQQGVISGFWNGIFMPRRTRRGFKRSERPFTTFQSSTSPQMPAVAPLPVLARSRKLTSMEHPPLRICLLGSDYPPEKTDGVARSTHTLAQGLAALGHEVHVIKRGRFNRTKVYDGAYVHEAQATQHYQYAGYPNTSSVLNYSDGVDKVIHDLEAEHQIQIVDTPLWQLEGLVTLFSKRIPCVVRPVTATRQIGIIHGTENTDTLMIGSLEEEMLNRADGIAINSTATRQSIESYYHVDLSKENHLYTPYGTIPAPDSAVMPLEITDDPIILFVGRLEQRKGILELFEAIPLVLREHPKARFWLTGRDNSEADGFKQRHGMSYPNYFRKQHPKAASNVEFLGFVPDAALSKLYSACTLFVAPSRYESFGLIHVEAMNYARPAIGCRAGGTTDIIVDGETGYLAEPGSGESLAEAIIKGLASPERLRQMGLAGRARVLSHFTHITMAKAFLQLYDQVLQATPTHI